MGLFKPTVALLSVYPDPDVGSSSALSVTPADFLSLKLRLGEWAKVAFLDEESKERGGWVLGKHLVEVEGGELRKVKLFSEPLGSDGATVSGRVFVLLTLEGWQKVRVETKKAGVKTGWIERDPEQEPAADAGAGPKPAGATLELGVNEDYRDAILQAGALTGIEPSALAALIDAEAAKIGSGANKGKWDAKSFNEASNAAGLTQFLASTWRDAAKRPGSQVNLAAKAQGFVTPGNAIAAGKEDALLQLRFEPTLSILAAAEYGLANLKFLEKQNVLPAGIDDDQRSRYIYLAHHEGASGAVAFLRGSNDTSRETFIKQVGEAKADALIAQAGGNVAAAYRGWLNGYMDAKIRPERFRSGPGAAAIEVSPSGAAELSEKSAGLLGGFAGSPIPVIELGGNVELAIAVQQALAELGFLDPPADGKFGPVSRWAIEEFCRLNGLPLAQGFTAQIARALLDPPIRLPAVARSGGWFDKLLGYMAARNYWICRHPACKNIVYVEGMNPDGTLNDDAPNVFNDLRLVFSVGTGGVPDIVSWEATTEPGRHYTLVELLNPGGAARIAFDQYKAWVVGTHAPSPNSAHEALVQAEAVTVHRDLNKDFKRPGDAIDTGHFGINQHWGYDAARGNVGNTSAGCLVGRTTNGHREFMALVKSDPRYLASQGYRFMTAIIPGDAMLR